MTPEQHAQRIRSLQLQLHLADYGMGMPRDYQRVLELRVMLEDARKEAVSMNIGQRMIAERQREIAVSMKALHMMQEHHDNRYMGFKCVRSDEEREWYAKAEKLIPPVEG